MPKTKSRELNTILDKAFGRSTFLTFRMTLAEALELGLLICECGHMPNNHFQWDKKPCAFCGDKCKQYRQKARVGKLVKQRKRKHADKVRVRKTT